MDRMNCGLLELKFAGADPAEMKFSGYGAVFGNVDAYGDVIQKGAFAETIAQAKASGQWPSMLQQHGGWGITADDLMPIGVWTAMSEDDQGLLLEGKLATTPRGQEMYTLLKMQPRPAINGLSIGYEAVKWKNGDGKTEPRRTLETVKLWEISPVTFPANDLARVQNVKSVNKILSEREFERLLTQDAGFSRSEARLIMKEGFKSFIAKQDAGDEAMQQIVEALNRRGDTLAA